MSAPTICQTCGNPIEKPADGKHVCFECSASGDPILRFRQSHRPDPVDLTPLTARLPKDEFIATPAWMAATGKKPKLPKEKEKENWLSEAIVAGVEKCERDGLRWGFHACIAFWILALVFAGVAIWWGCRQIL
jgi:hypothetical protein